MCKELLESLAKNLVSKPDEVSIEQKLKDDGSILLELRVGSGDMGRVIGKQGRIAKAIRTLMKAAATKDDVKVVVDIVD